MIEVTTQVELDAAVKAGETVVIGAKFHASAVLWENASAVLWGHTFARVFGGVVKAAATAIVAIHNKSVKATGGNQIRCAPPATAASWCAFNGIEVQRGIVVLYKAVGPAFESRHNNKFLYTPGSIPIAADWDGGKAECGGGLHFSATPKIAKTFHPDAIRYVACPVRIKDLRKPLNDDSYTDKIKGKGCCAPVWEVDEDGNKIETK